MKTFFIYCSLLLSCCFLSAQTERREQGNLVMDNIPEIPSGISDRLLQYQNTRSASVYNWDAKGNGLFITTRFGETAQLHYVEKPGGTRKQLTFFSEPVAGAYPCPDSSQNGCLFTKDIGGNENYQIYWFDLTSGKYKMLTDGKSRNENPEWNKKGTHFIYSSTKRNKKDYDLYICEATDTTFKEVMVMQGEGSWSPEDWSADNSKVIVSKYVSINESYGYILHTGSGQLDPINPSKEKISYDGFAFSKDEKGIYYISDEGSEFKRLNYYDLATKKSHTLSAGILWDVTSFSQSHDGTTLAFTANEDGYSTLYFLDTKTGKIKRPSTLVPGQYGGLKFHPKKLTIALNISTSKSPGDVSVFNLSDQSLKQWTFSEAGGLDTRKFAEPRLIRYTTFDSADHKPRMIPAYYYKPSGNGPFPVLVTIHGGPEAQSTPGFNPFLQYLINEMGIAVLYPNVRGSSGYGKTYLQLDNGFLRENSVKDIGALLDWIAKQPELDSKRIAVQGGSYGGYMTLASMTHFNDRLKAGIDVVGISNFVTFLESTSEYRRDLRRAEYGDERDPKMREFQQKISPTNNVQKITKPMFIIQGLNDPRVPASEAEQMVAAIRKNGGMVWYLLGKDEGHGFRKKVNRDYYDRAFVFFLEKYLLN